MMDEIADLEARVESAADLLEAVEARNALAMALRFSDLKRAIALCEQALELVGQPAAGSKPEQAGWAKSLFNLGTLLTQDGQFERALTVLNKAQLAYEVTGERENSARVLSAIGRVYIYLNDYPNALDYHLQALELAKRIGAQEVISISLNNIGFMYIHTQEWEKALDYLEQSLSLAEQSGDLHAQADALANCCYCHAQLGNYTEARQSGQRALSLYQEIDSPQGLAEVLANLGATYQMEGDDWQALENYQRSLQISESIGDRLEIIHTMRRVGETYVRLGKIEQGLEHLKQALELAQQISSRQEQYICHLALANAYRLGSNYAYALMHYEQYHSIKESIFNAEADWRLKVIEVEYRSSAMLQEAETFQRKTLALQQEVDERRAAEQALWLANERLQQEIVERERLISDLNAFAHMVAHDLKNPVNAIMGYTTLLGMRLKGSTDSQVLNYLEIISQTGQRMHRIIEELLLLASLREQKVELGPVDMAEVIREVEMRLEHMIRQYQAQVYKPDAWPIVLGYVPWLEEVWMNYLSNALKYGGNPPVVQLGYDILEGQVRFWVRDNGDGVAPEDQARLFNAFTRLEQTRVRGHGLGLSIVRRIVEKLNGEVGVVSSGIPGEGSLFTFTLPEYVQA